MKGPGKYDDVCTMVHKETDATTVVVIVIGGNKGHGFSVVTKSLGMLSGLPIALRDVADEIEADAAQEKTDAWRRIKADEKP